MNKPDDIMLRLDDHNYGMVATYFENGILTTEYATAPSAIETIEAVSNDLGPRLNTVNWFGDANDSGNPLFI